MNTITGLVFVALFFVGCKKDYTCECTNSSGTYKAGEIKATKAKADKTCRDLSSANTVCYLK